jgi:CHAT domain-containing protein
VREAATRQRFLDLAPTASVIHVAAHAIANEEFPDLSRLFMAADGGSSGAITSADLGRLNFSRTKIVVLAACGTAAGATFRGEGVTSLARPFLARGVAQVLGTLWQVDDQTSRRLFTEFHRGYVKGMPAAKALQQAQIAILRDHAFGSSNWAATVLIGSAASVSP